MTNLRDKIRDAVIEYEALEFKDKDELVEDIIREIKKVFNEELE